jgi:hypothetical protein
MKFDQVVRYRSGSSVPGFPMPASSTTAGVGHFELERSGMPGVLRRSSEWAIIRPVRHSTNQYASDNYGDGILMKIATSNGSQQGTATLGGSLARAAFDGANVWLANQSSNTVRKTSRH